MTERMTPGSAPGVTYRTAHGPDPHPAPDTTYATAPRTSHPTTPGTHPTPRSAARPTTPGGTHPAAQRASPLAVPPVMRPRAGRRPVFIDHSGWRRRLLQTAALGLGLVCLGYLAFVGALVTGFGQPVGTAPPTMNGPGPSGPDRAGPPGGGGIPSRAEVHRPPGNTEAGHQRSRQPVRRTGVQAGGLKQ